MKPDLAQSVNAVLDHISGELAKTQAALVSACQVVIEAGADGVTLAEYPSILIKCDEAEKRLRAQFEDGLKVLEQLRNVPHEEAMRASWTEPADDPWVR